MRLLVSVSGPDEAATALAAGADIIDAKDPAAGPLGRVSLATMRAISDRVAGSRLVTAALGDASHEQEIADHAAAFVAAGAVLVKVGFAGIADVRHIERLLAAAGRGSEGKVVAVAYADHGHAGTPPPAAILDAAIRAGAAGILIDTADKRAPGLLAVMSREALVHIAGTARRGGLLAAFAGKLTADDLSSVRDIGADIAGVRGAACEGGRTGRISGGRVAVLLGRLGRNAGVSMQSCSSIEVR